VTAKTMQKKKEKKYPIGVAWRGRHAGAGGGKWEDMDT